MFQIHTTEHVIAEVLNNKLKKHPLEAGSLVMTHMKQIRECLDEIVENFPGGEPFTGTDINDYHVHAAAIACQADIILTSDKTENITQDPDAEPYEIYTPDDFFTLVAKSNRASAFRVTQGQFNYWRSKPKSEPIDKALKKANCSKFAEIVRKHLQTIALTQ